MENKREPSIKLNMIMNGILTMSAIIFPLITFPYASRVLLPAGYGKLNIATSVVAYFAMFAQLGIPTYGIKACARVRDNKEELSRIVHELLMISMSITMVVYVAYAGSLMLVPRFRDEKALYIITGTTILLNTIGVEWLYKALEKYTYITIRSVVFKLIALIAMFLLVKEQSDYVIYGAISIFAASASNILNFINMRKLVYIKPLGNYNLKRHLKPVMLFFAMSVATVVYTNLDNVMLGFMKGDEAAGYYSAAVKIKVILVSFLTSASTVLLPRASYYVDKGKMEEFLNILRKAMHLVFVMSIPCAAYFMLYAREGILLLSGREYEGAIMPMIIIMPTIILIGVSNVIGIQMLVPLGREKQVLHSEIIGAVVDLILNVCLIPSFGVSGAAVGTLVAEVTVVIWQLGCIKKDKSGVIRIKQTAKIIIIAMVATAASLVGFLFEGTLARLVISAFTFGIVYMLGIILTKDEVISYIIKSKRPADSSV